MPSMYYPPGTLISRLLTNNQHTAYGPDQAGFASFLGACQDLKRNLGLATTTFYIQDNIENRIVYDWDYLLEYYFSDLRQDQWFMADAYWHSVMVRNAVNAKRVWPIIELEQMFRCVRTLDMNLQHIHKTFTSLVNNRNDSRYLVHQHLYDQHLMDHCVWSWQNNRDLGSFYNNNRWAGIRDRDYRWFPEQQQPGTTWEPDMTDQDLVHHWSSAITLCYQTIFHGCGPVYDGKIFKCFLAGRPFVLIGSSGTLADLRDQGFRTFGHMIDESYDTQANPSRRMSMILRELDRLAATPLQDLVQQIQDSCDIIEHNFLRCREIAAGLEQCNPEPLIMPLCLRVADYDNNLSANQVFA